MREELIEMFREKETNLIKALIESENENTELKKRVYELEKLLCKNAPPK